MLAVTPASSCPHVNSASANTTTPKYLPSLAICIPHPPRICQRSTEVCRADPRIFSLVALRGFHSRLRMTISVLSNRLSPWKAYSVAPILCQDVPEWMRLPASWPVEIPQPPATARKTNLYWAHCLLGPNAIQLYRFLRGLAWVCALQRWIARCGICAYDPPQVSMAADLSKADITD